MLARSNDHPLEEIPESFPNALRWYVFYTHVHAEKRAADSIKKEIGLPVFVPFEKRAVRRPGSKERLYEAPLFPRYGFVQFDINDYRWGDIKDAKGVVDLLKWDCKPRPVPNAVIDGLRLADKIGVFDRTKAPQVGMDVQLTFGPFADFVGKVKRARAKDKVDVLLEFLGGKRVIEAVPLAWMRQI